MAIPKNEIKLRNLKHAALAIALDANLETIIDCVQDAVRAGATKNEIQEMKVVGFSRDYDRISKWIPNDVAWASERE